MIYFYIYYYSESFIVNNNNRQKKQIRFFYIDIRTITLLITRPEKHSKTCGTPQTDNIRRRR